jgi:hypothetical protein
MLLARHLHLVLGSEAVLRYEASKLNGAHNLYYDSDHPIEIRPLHIGILRTYKHHQSLIQDIDRMMLVFKRSGRLDQLKKQHGLI